MSVVFDTTHVGREINSRSALKVALQFPDSLLATSLSIVSHLSTICPSTELFILGDTTYGSCCVDEVAAEHVGADLIVHYGHSCRSRTVRIPVIYVYDKEPVDIESCEKSIVSVLQTALDPVAASDRKRLQFAFDTKFQHAASSVIARFNALGYSARLHSLSLHPDTAKADESSSLSNTFEKAMNLSPPEDDDVYVYVGQEGMALSNFLIRNTGRLVLSYDPSSGATVNESPHSSKLLMRRYALYQKSRDANVIGIVVGTLGVSNYLATVQSLRELIIARHKKPYLISVGKPNPAKLANFSEVDVFVLVACPENSLLDSKEFYRPIVTPFELHLALGRGGSGGGAGGWTGVAFYETDLEALAPKLKAELQVATRKDGDDEDDDEGEARFSFVTGGLTRTVKYEVSRPANAMNSKEDGGSDEKALLVRGVSGLVTTSMKGSAAADFLESRTFKGLEIDMGATPVEKATDGRAGIASKYQDDDH